ncbi:MAG: adenylate/guanylate cyclase domain-containing protein [Lachnospiraceae bacterium]|nr:adenylate/guanylate cyclase domain-containing protein [Lachnospiraceae bacterium]
MKKKKTLKFLLPLVPAVLMFLMAVFEPFYGADAAVCDVIYRQMDGTGDTVKLISVDEETLAEYGKFSEWSREKSAELLEYLFDGSDNEPAVVAFDTMFIDEGDAITDERLAKAAEGNRVIGASNLVYRGETKKKDGVIYFDKNNIAGEELPYDSLDAVISSGFANVSLSKDGFVRSTKLYVDIEGERRYSLATQTYLTYMELQGQKDSALEGLAKHDEVGFFFSGKPGEFSTFSLSDVLNGNIPKTEFRDSIVMVGAYAPGFQDAYHSAARRGTEMYGVEINANIVNALLTGKTAFPVNKVLAALIFALVIYAYAFMAREMKMYPAILVGVWVVASNLLIGRILAKNGKLISLFYFLLLIVLIVAWIIIEKYVTESLNKKKVLNTFKKYMAPQVIENLAKDDEFKIEIGGVKRNVAVLFVDIRGFTTMSEALSPEEIVKILNRYLSLTTECIFDHGGMLDKFIGDATMAIFNAPNDQEDYVYQAVLAGLDMRKKGKVLGEELLAEYGKTVSFGVGINVGDAVVGNIGSENRMDYTAIGDTVNTASRIEGKSLGGEVLISEAVYELLKERIGVEFKDEVMLKGKALPVRIYNVLGEKQ